MSAKAKAWYDAGAREEPPGTLVAKLQVREKVVETLGPGECRVLDLFSGADRRMYEGVWKKAAAYVACDARPWKGSEPARYVCDNRLLLRAIDLSPWNVYDLDAYTDAWDQLLILAHRRTWAPGERGAIVLTDTSQAALAKGKLSRSLARLVGMEVVRGEAAARLADDVQGRALKAWATTSRVTPTRIWVAQGSKKAKGTLYEAVVFEGVKP